MKVLSNMTFFFMSWFSSLGNSFSAQPSMTSPLTKDHLKIAKICRDVYTKEVESLDTFVQSKDTGIQATVSLDGKRAIVCFRGSNQLKDWFLNLNMGKLPFLSRKHSDEEKKVHSGFFIGHNSIKSKIYKKLNLIIESGECESILFTGHSLGASLSALSAFDYVNDKNIPIEVVTFGSPRIGNKLFCDDFNDKISAMRIVNDRDIVTVAPLQLMKFHHVGKPVQINDSDVVLGESTLLQRISWRAMGVFGFDMGFKDHMMDAYISEIEKCLKEE